VTVATNDSDNLVALHDACPACGERDVDRLVWIGTDGDRVRCATCGTEYDPQARTKGGDDA
jgi:predicted RNA-binding Zn-ribbon protein involved in translation (DUF1610 family)